MIKSCFRKILHYSFGRESGNSFAFSALLLISLCSLPYLAWEIFWYTRVGYAFIKWHTHLALYLYLWICLMWMLEGIHYFFKLTDYGSYKLFISSLCGILLLVEIFLVSLGIGDTYEEKIKTGYRSKKDTSYETYYRRHMAYEHYYIQRPEFSYLRTCNSLGYSDIEWPMTHKAGEKRFLFLGDSFTEGVGAPEDSCYPSILRKILYRRDTNITTMNGASAGDDPCVNYVNYRDILSAYRPDIIVQTLSSNDLNTDMATKGGLERFQPDGKIRFTKPVCWEPIYALSYISRLFFRASGYNELLLKMPLSPSVQNQLNQKAIQAIKKYSAEAQKNQATLLIVLQPYSMELYKKHYDYDLNPIIRQISMMDNVKVYDLMPAYLSYFKGREDSIQYYYWPGDGHHNAKGYAVMAGAVESALDSFHLVPGGQE